MNSLKISITVFLLIFFMSEITQAQDWANLNRFKKANAELQIPTKNENRVVFMGNSITESWENLNPSFFVGKSYINRGISGQTTPQMLLRFRADVINLNPKVVVILAGTNDIAGNTGPISLEEIILNIISMTELAEANGIKVVLSSVLPAFDYPWRPGKDPDTKISILNEMIKSFASKKNRVYLDYFSTMVNEQKGLKEAYTYDGVHPNKVGYEIMGPLADKAIAKALSFEKGL